MSDAARPSTRAANVGARKPVVIFAGAFSFPPDGTIGGQLFACRTLLDSPLSEFVTWRLIDSSRGISSRPGTLTWLCAALGRMLRLSWYLLTARAQAVLIFTPFEPTSLAEKGLMCWLARVFRKPVVLSIRSEIPGDMSRSRRLLWRWVARGTTAIVCPSSIDERKLLALSDCQSKVRVITNWIDTSRYEARTAETRSNSLAPVVLFVGWLEAYKGVNELIAAAEMLHARQTPFRLVICGSGSLERALRERCQQNSLSAYVEFRGWQTPEQARQEFRNADIFALPSYTEGLSNALLEAMACGLPLVTTPVGNLPSVIRDGENGLLVERKDAAALAAALERLLTDSALRARLGAQARRDVVANHDIHQLWPALAAALQVPCPPTLPSIPSQP